MIFCAFEATSRSGRGVAVTLLIPLLVLLLTPRVRPRRLLPLLLTYLLPVLPVLIWWDGLASTLCTYTAGELERLARELSDERCQWWVRELPVPGAPIPVLSLIGAPIATTIGAMPGDIVAHPSVDFTWRAFSQQLLSSCTRTRWGCSPGMLVTNDPWLIQQRRDR